MAPSIRRFKIEKLVRDHIEDLFNNSGAVQVNKTILTDKQFLLCLRDKISEEAQEVVNATTAAELVDECADLMEVIGALLALHQKTWKDVQDARTRKALTRGLYKNRLYINSVDLPDGSEATRYYESNPTKYPEIDSE
ncbi:TPA: hypothetical protein DDZ86_05060 [Candidatus Dependentiae bacterium]|nr:MAG: hypothetical protein A2Y17_09865 [Clostridiales bacterium GWF2_38_85]HBL98981.1 hypothetical protein [Candidatus Dependentiae bacterium]